LANSRRGCSTFGDQGFLIAPVSYIELSPLFDGVEEAQNEFLEGIAVAWTHGSIWPDTMAAHRAWYQYNPQTQARPDQEATNCRYFHRRFRISLR